MRAAIACGVASSLALAITATVAAADDIRVPSKLDAVTVYPQGAEITRVAKVRIPAGEHAIILSDLPAAVVPNSIRVEGRASGRLEIGSVDSRRLAVPRDDAAALASERKRIENEIEKLRDDKAILQAAVQAAETQKALVTNLAQLPTHPAPSGTGVAGPDWGLLLGRVGERLEKAQRAIVDLGVKSREIDRTIEDLGKKLASLAPAPLDRTEVKVFVVAPAALETELVVRYQVGNAAWTPLYDARLATGAKGVAAKLQLVRRASIQQRTGESWDDVTLALSTARPSAATAAPELQMLSVDYQPDRPSPMVQAPASIAAGRVRSGAALGVGGDIGGLAKNRVELDTAEVKEIAAELSTAAFQAVYAIPGRVTVAQTGEVKRVLIGQDELEPQLLVRTVPRFDQTAYLYTRLVLPKTMAPILAGQVALFRDGVFAGNGRLPQKAPGETHELGFGADDLVKVKRIVLEDKKGESGVFTTSRVEARNFQISVKNLRGQPLQVTVLDRVPVSMQDDIKVEPSFSPQPSRRDVEDRRGTVAWDFQAAPDEEKLIAFGYRVTAPVAKPYIFRELTQEQITVNSQQRF